MKSYLTIGMTTMLTLALVAVTLTTAAYAQTTSNPNTDQPNRWGQTTSGAAQQDTRDDFVF